MTHLTVVLANRRGKKSRAIDDLKSLGLPVYIMLIHRLAKYIARSGVNLVKSNKNSLSQNCYLILITK